jgi:hypothetical protein
MTNFTPITFAQDKSNTKVVVADRYVPHDIYVLNKAIIESLGGTILKGVGGFKAEFTKVADAKAFIKQAITHISEDEYKANRKPKEADEKPKVEAKGSKKPKVRKGKGNDAPTSAVQSEEVKQEATPAETPELTPAQQKALAKMRMSILNRAASAYSIANGGQATTFSALGKSEQELEAYLPNAKAGLLKSPKWASAVEKHGLTEAMLG